MPNDLPKRILEYLDRSRDDMYALLERLVLCESPSGDPASLAQVLQLLCDAFSERAFRAQVLVGKESGGMLLAIPENRPRHRPYQLLLGHCDTVWPVGTLETMPAKTDEEGRFWGPGSYDMKAGLVQGLFAIEALAASGLGALDVTPVFFINSDEEVGSHDSTRVIKRLARGADRIFVVVQKGAPVGGDNSARNV